MWYQLGLIGLMVTFISCASPSKYKIETRYNEIRRCPEYKMSKNEIKTPEGYIIQLDPECSICEEKSDLCSISLLIKGNNWIVLGKGASLTLLIDSQRFDFTGYGTTDGVYEIQNEKMTVARYYENVTPELFRQIATAQSVELIVRGRKATFYGEKRDSGLLTPLLTKTRMGALTYEEEKELRSTFTLVNFQALQDFVSRIDNKQIKTNERR